MAQKRETDSKRLNELFKIMQLVIKLGLELKFPGTLVIFLLSHFSDLIPG